jgi:glycosyltransferase involved in cell wall biosynthesis
MENNPLVSVLMTAYNREKFIAEAIESVIKQTYVNWELIIVDDGSRDKTVEIASVFMKKDSRISLYVNKRNLGDYPNRNYAASKAKGEYIMYVDSDDYISIDAIEYIVVSFCLFPELKQSTLYGDCEISPYVLKPYELMYGNFIENNLILAAGPGARVFKKSFFDHIGGYPEKYGPANDMYFNVKSAIVDPILILSKKYTYYRDHDQQESKNKFSYLVNGYIYFNDAMKIDGIQLDKQQIKKLLIKNKRRFVVNTIKYFLQTMDIQGIYTAKKLTGFSLKDLFIAVFN